MRAKIIGEDDHDIGVEVVDNEQVDHHIEFHKNNGEIYAHDHDYPDDNELTPEQKEELHQARNYARYYVSTETEYGPFETKTRIDSLEQVRKTITGLSDEEFEAHFSDLWRQVLGNHPDIEPPVEFPSSVGLNDFVLFEVDIYLDDDGQLAAVSDIHQTYYDEQMTQIEQRNDDPFENRTPDATLQVVRDLIPSLTVFQEYIDYHLRCQLRDCYHEMGVEPPAEYRVLGRGDHEIAKRYRNDDVSQYEHYHDKSAEISGYELDFDYGFGVLGKAAMSSLDGGEETPTEDELRSLFNPDAPGDGGLLDKVRETLSEDDSTEE